MSSRIVKNPQVIVFFGFVVLVIVIIIVSIGFLQPQNKLQTREVIILSDGTKANINEFPINHAEHFMYPPSYEFGKSENAYQMFSLIRLPEEFGGDKDDISAFRAYSAMDLESHCLTKYWPREERIQDPCHAGIYRPQDGIMIRSEPKLVNMFNGLPYLDLSTDYDGYLYVEPPVWELDKNGVIGIGRTVSVDTYKKAAIVNLNEYLTKNESNLDVPLQLNDNSVLTLGLTNHDFVYRNPDNIKILHYLEISYCNCTGPSNDEWYLSSHAWKLADELLYVENFDQLINEQYYGVTFFRDGYRIKFSAYGSFEKVVTLVLDNFYENKNYSMLEKA